MVAETVQGRTSILNRPLPRLATCLNVLVPKGRNENIRMAFRLRSPMSGQHSDQLSRQRKCSPVPPWTVEKELDFSLHEPSSEMWHVCDDLLLAFKTLRGDGSITVRIESIAPPHYATEAVLMIRSTLAPSRSSHRG
jgi:hypothetical protein